MKNQILQGDVLTMGRKLGPGLVNLILTSPPYFNCRDYSLLVTDWPEVIYVPLHGLPLITIPAQKCCLGREKTLEAYVGHLVLIFRELQVGLRDDGVLWLNLGDSYANDTKKGGDSGNKNYTSISGGYQDIRFNPPQTGLPNKNLCGVPWRVALAMQADGWVLRNDVIWSKTNGTPESMNDRCTKSHEYLFLFSKAPQYWFDTEAIKTPIKQNSLNRLGRGVSNNHKLVEGVPGQRQNLNSFHRPRKNVKFGGNKADGNEWEPKTNMANRRTVWSMATANYGGGHYAVMPSEMAELCILSGCPPHVCDECEQPHQRAIETVRETSTFEPVCTCDVSHRPGIVLDPFFGAGTVGVVAKQLKRHFIGIELNADYVKMAQKRLDETQPALFAR